MANWRTVPTLSAWLLVSLVGFWAWGQAADSRWIEVVTPNFRVVSNATPEAAKEAALGFEQFRTAIQQALPGARVDPGQPILILAVKDEESLRRLLPQFWERPRGVKPSGVFFKGPERHYVALRLDASGPTPLRTLYHEYVHLLLDLNLPQAPPWLSEGMAEFFAHTRITPDEIAIGLLSQAHLTRLRSEKMLPLQQLFSVSHDSAHYGDSDKASIFYSQSWALTHLLMTTSRQDGTNAIEDFFALLQQDVDPRRAASRTLGDFGVLRRQLVRYISQDEFPYYPLPNPKRGRLYAQTRYLVPSEADAIQAAFLVRNRRHREARSLINRALTFDPNQSLAYESLGYLHYQAGQHSQAASAFERAVDLNTSSYLAHYLFSVLSLSGKFASTTHPHKIETSLRNAIRLRPTFGGSYSTLSRIVLDRSGDPAEAVDLALSACKLEPRNAHFLQTLGYALIANQEFDAADEIVAKIRSVSNTRRERQLADRLAKDVQRMGAAAREQRRYEHSRAEMDAESDRLAAITQRDIEWVEGRVQDVSCSAPARMEIRMQSGRESFEFETWNFTVVEFLVPQELLDFKPCQNLKGSQALIRFFMDPDSGTRKLVAVELASRLD